MPQTIYKAGMKEKQWFNESADQKMRFISDLGLGVIDWLEPIKGDRVLDLGCGDGILSERIMARGCEVVGVDINEDALEQTRNIGIEAYLMDANDLGFEDEFSAVFSNATLHWFKDQAKVINNVHKSLKEDGRFVGELGGFGNIASVVGALRVVALERGIDPDLAMPWYFPTVEEYTNLLEKSGFRVDRIITFARPTLLPMDFKEYLELTFHKYFDALGADRDAVLDLIEVALESTIKDNHGSWYADFVRLRFAAVKI